MRLISRVFAILVLVGMPSVAAADDVATSVIAQANAPATITRCVVSNVSTYSFGSSFNLYDRSTHNLIDASIEYRFFDRDNTQIGNTTYVYTPGETVASQDTTSFNNNYHSVSLAEPASAVSRVTCRLTSAHFTGRLGWKRGTPWLGGALSAIPKADSERDDSAAAPRPSVAHSNSPANGAITHLKFDVEKAWNDVVQGGVYVHDALVIHGGENPATFRASDFVLTMALANGAKQTYPALTRAAPTYQKYNAFTKEYATAYEIDPTNDLGGLGSLIVAAHTDVLITVTFAVPDQIADASANRQVSIK